MKVDVSVIIVNRNGHKVLKECLESLLPCQTKEIIVVDNASADRSLTYLAQLKEPCIKVIKNKNNNGYAEANNQGYELATGSYVLFLNNDTIVNKDFLAPLVDALKQDTKLAAIQPLILFPDGTIDSVGSFLTPTGFLYHKAHRQPPIKKNTKDAKVYSMKGACMLWKKSVLDEIGVFDESYFAYFEETDLCNRAIKAGYHVRFTGKSSIIHLGGFTSNTMNQGFIQYYNTKNRLFTYFRHLPSKVAWNILPFHILLTQALICKTILNHPSVALEMQKGMLAGIRDGIKGRMQEKGDREYDLASYIKKPDISYYVALFTSLKGYNKVW